MFIITLFNMKINANELLISLWLLHIRHTAVRRGSGILPDEGMALASISASQEMKWNHCGGKEPKPEQDVSYRYTNRCRNTLLARSWLERRGLGRWSGPRSASGELVTAGVRESLQPEKKAVPSSCLLESFQGVSLPITQCILGYAQASTRWIKKEAAEILHN